MTDNEILKTGYKFGELASDPIDDLDQLSGKEREQRIEYMRSVGMLKPSDDGFFTEAGQGFLYSTTHALKGVGTAAEKIGLGEGMRRYFQSVLSCNQQWNRPEDLEGLSYCGRMIGECWFITIPLLLIFFWWSGKKGIHWLCSRCKIAHTKRNESKELAMTELESGNLDKLTWANALIRAKGNETKAKAEYLRLRRR